MFISENSFERKFLIKEYPCKGFLIQTSFLGKSAHCPGTQGRCAVEARLGIVLTAELDISHCPRGTSFSDMQGKSSSFMEACTKGPGLPEPIGVQMMSSGILHGGHGAAAFSVVCVSPTTLPPSRFQSLVD